jgi:hypothetical protein
MSIGCLFNPSTFSTCLINTDRVGWSAFIGLRKECLHDMSARQRAAALPPSVMRRDAPAPWHPSGTVPPAAGVRPQMNLDDRPVIARGAYDLSFVDSVNESETVSLERLRVDASQFQNFFQQYLAHLSNTDFVSDADFDRDFTYDRLLQLDAALVRSAGLSRSQLARWLKPVRGVVADCCICMETSARTARMARVGCGHTFHCSCLERWLRSQHTCPLCRCDLRHDGTPPDVSRRGARDQ